MVQPPKLTDVPGIGAVSAGELRNARIQSVQDLIDAPAATLGSIHGFGPHRVAKVREAALVLLSQAAAPGPPANSETPANATEVVSTKKKGKGMGKKKDKKKDGKSKNKSKKKAKNNTQEKERKKSKKGGKSTKKKGRKKKNKKKNKKK